MLKIKGEVKPNSFTQNKLLWLEENEYFSETTKQVYLDFIILYAHPVEVFKGKDLTRFTSSEITELFQNLPKIKERNASTLWSAVNSYLAWGSKRGLCPQGNPCDGLEFLDIVKVNKDAIKSTYIKLDWFWNKIKEFNTIYGVDYKNLIIPVLYRYGIISKLIRFVKWCDIDEKDMCISVWNEKRDEIVNILPIDNDFLTFCEKLYKDSEINIENYDMYHNNNYIISKKSKGKTVNEIVNKNTIYTRYNYIFSAVSDNRFNINNLLNSRKYDMLFNILESKGKVTKKDVTDVYNTFVGKESHTGEFNLRKDFEIIADIKIE